MIIISFQICSTKKRTKGKQMSGLCFSLAYKFETFLKDGCSPGSETKSLKVSVEDFVEFLSVLFW